MPQAMVRTAPWVGDVQESERTLSRLHASYVAKRLAFVVGAGASMASGLPSWGTLNRRLLSGFFRLQLEAAVHEPEELQALGSVFDGWFGGSAIVDLIRKKLKKKDAFARLLHDALYEGIADPELQPIHIELAATLRPTKGRSDGLYTFNFDDLLERALKQVHGRKDSGRRVLTRTSRKRQSSPARHGQVWVSHLHGFLPFQPASDAPHARGALILSEKDYLDTDGSWADQALEDLLGSGKDILLVGLSLSDSRLRRLLFMRLQEKHLRRGQVFAILTTPRDDKPQPSRFDQGAGAGSVFDVLIRKAQATARRYEPEYWKDWGVTVLRVDIPWLIPFLLRRIRCGSNTRDWARDACAILRQRASASPALYHPKTQGEACEGLAYSLDFIRRRFAVRTDEEIEMGFFVPVHRGSRSVLKLAFVAGAAPRTRPDSPGPRPGGPSPDPDDGKWELNVGDIEQPQGAAGFAYVWGAEVEAKRGSAFMDANFTSEMRAEWGKGRVFSSVLCIPILDVGDSIPIGVACVCSNRTDPFWASLAGDDRLELAFCLRQLYTDLLKYKP